MENFNMEAGKREELPSSSNTDGNASIGESRETLNGSSLGPADDKDQVDHGPGIYAIPVPPFSGEWAGSPSSNLIPIKYNVPRGTAPAEGATGDAQQEVHPQREGRAVRRFHLAIQIDLMLILKLAAVVILFNQEGSRQRLVLLILFASIIYLYQAGAFAPLIRWLRQAVGGPALMQPPAHRPVADGNVQNEVREERGENGVNWGGIVREIKVLVVSFLASLFPGFHIHND